MAHHVPSGSLRHVEYSGQVHRDDLVPFLRGYVQERMTNTDAGIIDDHLQAAHDPGRVLHCGLDLGQVRHVGVNRPGQIGQGLLNPLPSFGVSVQHTHGRAFLQKSGRGCCADSAGPARNQDAFSP